MTQEKEENVCILYRGTFYEMKKKKKNKRKMCVLCNMKIPGFYYGIFIKYL